MLYLNSFIKDCSNWTQKMKNGKISPIMVPIYTTVESFTIIWVSEKKSKIFLVKMSLQKKSCFVYFVTFVRKATKFNLFLLQKTFNFSGLVNTFRSNHYIIDFDCFFPSSLTLTFSRNQNDLVNCTLKKSLIREKISTSFVLVEKKCTQFIGIWH